MTTELNKAQTELNKALELKIGRWITESIQVDAFYKAAKVAKAAAKVEALGGTLPSEVSSWIKLAGVDGKEY